MPLSGPVGASADLGQDLHTRVDPEAMATFMRADPRTGTWGDDACEVLVNPTNFKETIGAAYSLRPVLGLSHEVVQYVKTNSRKITMELWLSFHVMRMRGSTEGPARLLVWRNWFESLLVPGGLGLAPPLVAVHWPGADLNFVGVVETLNIEYERFTHSGAPMEIKLDLAMIEVASRFMSSSAVKSKGIGTTAALATGPNPTEPFVGTAPSRRPFTDVR